MNNNIFSHIFKARKFNFSVDEEAELIKFKKDIVAEINCERPCSAPRFIMFKLTERCNSSCIYCGYSAKKRSSIYKPKKDLITLNKCQDILEQAGRLGVLGIAYNGGEPLLHESITEIIASTINNNISPILMTNGLLLPEKWDKIGKAGLKYVMISLDSLDEDVFRLHRGVSLERTLNGVEAAMKMREKYGDMIIHITAVITRYNISEISKLAEFSRKNDIWLEVCAYHHTIDADKPDLLSVTDKRLLCSEIETIKKLQREGTPISTSYEYIDHIESFFIEHKNKPDNYKCMGGYTTLQVDSKLDVRPCWESSFGVLGNLRDNTIAELWCGSQMQEYRKKMLAGQCSGCWNMCNEVTALLKEV